MHVYVWWLKTDVKNISQSFFQFTLLSQSFLSQIQSSLDMASLAILIALIIRCFGLQKLELQAGYNVYISLMWVLGIQTHSPPFSSKSIIYLIFPTASEI